MTARRTAPVFVMGSPRSGTTYFYHLLLSAGEFAIYRSEARVFDMIAPHFGDLRVRRHRQALLDAWLKSEYFRRTGLEAQILREKVLAECRSAGDFLRIVMDCVARRQNVRRWAECTPHNVLHLKEIKKSLPNALFIHMIRDGRDVAFSMAKQGWVRPFSWDRDHLLLVAGLYWEWFVSEGRKHGRSFVNDYMEVKYEELVENPRETLAGVASFIEHELDYDRILQAGIGSVSDPNTSFGAERKSGKFQPVGRWKSGIARESLAELEAAIGPTLEDLGYPFACSPAERTHPRKLKSLRSLYQSYFSAKHWLKSRTPLGRLTKIDLLQDFHAFDQDRLMPEAKRN